MAASPKTSPRNMFTSAFRMAMTAGRFDPLSLSPNIWFDASDSSTLFDATSGGSTPAADGGVARLVSKTGAAYGAQATSGRRPLRRVAYQNGLDALFFDGTTDELGLANPITTSTTFTLTAAIRNGGNAGYGSVLVNSAGGAGFYLKANKVNAYSAADKLASSTLASGTFYVLTIQVSAGAVSFFKDGSADGTASGMGSYVTNALGGHGAEWFSGHLGELLLFPSALSTTDRQNTERYLGAKWGITVA